MMKRRKCLACLRKRNIENLEVFREKKIVVRDYICKDNNECARGLIVQIKKVINK